MIWVGLDLHKKYITACALDDAGAIVAEHRRLPADAEALVTWLTGRGGAVTVVMEATRYWAWLHDQLSAAGIAAVAAHPYQVKLIWQARAKTDPVDARKLADLLRTNLLPVAWVPTLEIRGALEAAPGPVGEQYQRLLRSKGKAKATVAAARKLSCYLYWCLQEGWSYEQWLRQHDKREVRSVHALGSAA